MDFITLRYPVIFKSLALMLFTVSFVACSEKEDPAPQVEEDNLVEATLKGSRSAAELQFFVEVSGMDLDPAWFVYDVDIYDVTYTTLYKDEEVEASGVVLLPKAEAAFPMASFQRGTIVRQSEAPTMASLNSEAVISAAALASTGFITVAPDLLGFGASSEKFHPYYIEEPTAQAVIDLLRAAATLTEQKNIQFNQRLFLAGYSQGGYATLATHKALESKPLDDFNVIASFPGAGGYDLMALQSYFFNLDSYNAPIYLAYIGMSYQSWYEQPDLLPSFFNEPYASQIPGLFDGNHAASEINSGLTYDVQALVNPAILTEGDPMHEFLMEKFTENSLTDWTPTTPVFMYHGDADTTVPYENSEIAYQTFINNGADPNLITLTRLAGENHNSAVVPYLVEVITKLQEMK